MPRRRRCRCVLPFSPVNKMVYRNILRYHVCRGAAAAEKVKEKRNKYKHTLRPEQYLQTLAFESEGYTSPEAQQLLLVWA